MSHFQASRLLPRMRADIGSTQPIRARSSAVEYYLDTGGVTGSIPVAPTIFSRYCSCARLPGAPGGANANDLRQYRSAPFAGALDSIGPIGTGGLLRRLLQFARLAPDRPPD